MTAANQNWILFVLNLRRTRNAAMLMEKKSSLEKKNTQCQPEWMTYHISDKNDKISYPSGRHLALINWSGGPCGRILTEVVTSVQTTEVKILPYRQTKLG